jgi:hypothetical protein
VLYGVGARDGRVDAFDSVDDVPIVETECVDDKPDVECVSWGALGRLTIGERCLVGSDIAVKVAETVKVRFPPGGRTASQLNAGRWADR